VEQAVAPEVPVSPTRPLIAAAGLGGGLMLGLGLVVLLEAMNRAIRRPVDLTAKLGITPFATLPFMRTARQRRRRRWLIALAFLAVLAGIPLGLWAIDTYYMPLDLLIGRGVTKLGLDGLVDQLRQSVGQ
jgi:uncharacterized protein involved in exopolysaccharide biosynthesis